MLSGVAVSDVLVPFQPTAEEIQEQEYVAWLKHRLDMKIDPLAGAESSLP